MYIKTKVMLILFSLFVSFGILQFVAQKYFIFPSFVELEQAGAKTNLQRVVEAIKLQLSNLDSMNFDWSAWDDTYQFMQDYNEDYLQSNLVYETQEGSILNLMFFYNMDHELFWGRVYNLETETQLDNKPFLQIVEKLIRPGITLARTKNELVEAQFTGIVPVQDSYLMLAVRPVLTSENKGPAMGYVVFGRLLTETIIDDIRSQTKIDFELSPVQQKELNAYQNSGYRITRINTQKLAVSTLMNGYDGHPLLRVDTISPRKITQNGLTSIRYSMISVGLLSMLILLMVLLLLQRIVLQPVSRLASHMTALTSSGDYSSQLTESRTDEIGMLAKAYNSLLQQINTTNEQLIRIADQDQLTELPNRRWFWRYLESECRRGQREKNPLSLMMIDIDYFKAYNDNYGHVEGDACLYQVAQILKNCLNRPADKVVRYGGEEFVIVLPNTPADGALHIGEKILQHVAEAALPHAFSEVSDVISVSIGIASRIPLAQINMQQLLTKSDQALYQAKTGGRNRQSIFADEADMTAYPG